MHLRLAVLAVIAVSGLNLGTSHAASPLLSSPQVIAPPELPAIQAIRAATRDPNAAPLDSAPMPDADADAPSAAQSTDTQLKPAFYANKTQFRGDGFAGGDTAQAVQDRSARPAAGLALNVPLD